MKNDLIEKNTSEELEDTELVKRKKQKVRYSDLSPIEVAASQNDSILSFSSHSTPMSCHKKENFNCQALTKKRKYSEEDENYCYFKSDIDSILKCPFCHKFFDLNEKLPKMVCDRFTICLECTKNNTKINCKFCDQYHEVSDRTNSTILAIITIKPTKINNEELVIQSKCQKIINEAISVSNSIGKVNHVLKEKLDKFYNEIKNMNSKSDLKQAYDNVKKIKQTFCSLKENICQLEPVLSINNAKKVNIEISNDNIQMVTVYFDFDSLQDKNWFHPINKKIFFCMESESKQDLSEIKLKIINNKQELICQKLVKNFTPNSTMVSFDSKNLILILSSLERQIICVYEISGTFNSLKFLNAEKRIIYVNQVEIMIYVEKKKCIAVVDHDFNKKAVFGQTENENADFYFPETGFEIVFANQEKIVIKDLEQNCLRLMTRTNGKYAGQFCLNSMYRDKIFVIKMKMLVMVHQNFDKVDFLDLDLKLVKRIDLKFDSEINDCYLAFDNYLAFVNFEKCFIIFVKL